MNGSALPNSVVSTITVPFRVNDVLIHPPCIIIDGVISRPMTMWLATEAELGSSPSTLEQYAHALVRFAEYHLTFGHKAMSSEELVRGFSRCLDAGESSLGWPPLDTKVASRYFDAFCKFFDWLLSQKAFECYEHPNPIIERQMTAGECMAANRRSLHSDMLHHLYPLTKQGRGIRELRRYANRNRWGGCQPVSGSIDQPGSGWAPDGMSIDDYVELVTSEQEPRNRLLWLLIGAGAARISEALQVFASDIYYDPSSREGLVALANPVKGKVVLTDQVTMERRQFLKEHYRMSPRCLLPRSHPLHAGWKGMMLGGFDDQVRPMLADWRNRMWSLVEWMMPSFGRMFWQAHIEYMERRTRLRPQHPYYFVNVDHNVGAPLTRSAAKQLLETACIRAGVRRSSPHKLRHMYGNYLASVGIPLSDAQIMMRHLNPKSTLVYYKVKRAVARERLTLAERQEILTRRERNLPFLFQITP